jgi:hypothetical protein
MGLNNVKWNRTLVDAELISFQQYYGPGVYSASKRNEYRESSLWLGDGGE